MQKACETNEQTAYHFQIDDNFVFNDALYIHLPGQRKFRNIYRRT